MDIERGVEYKPLAQSEDGDGIEQEETATRDREPFVAECGCFANVRGDQHNFYKLATASRFNFIHLFVSFFAGVFVVLALELFVLPERLPFSTSATSDGVKVAASSDAGSTTVHNFPPASPTNAFPSLFPTDIGYAGATPTGGEAGVVATAPSYPLHSGAPVLINPTVKGGSKGNGKGRGKKFDLFKSWGNLSPWYSVKKGAFGVDSSPEAPEGCRVTGLHFLHRHGARYPTAWSSYGGPAKLAKRLHDTSAQWSASGELNFLNEWTYKLGEEILTPFGRQQLYDLGVSMRIKYGFLLENFTEANTIPVFRTESQDRMLYSALNFAMGFFGLPIEGKYQQSVTIEADGFNNTLAPYKTCPNARDPSKADRAIPYVEEWVSIYLHNARERLQKQLNGYTLSNEDVYILQQMCAYETVAIGYSKFCGLFTEEEWNGFAYALDLYFWYDSAFGSPVARIQGVGYIQEMLARLTHTPIQVHNSSTNSTLDDDERTFPLDHALYVDATHEVVVLNVITALNLTDFARSGPLPSDHIPSNRSFDTSQLSPFATNVQFQLLSCTSEPGPQIRVIINDGVATLTGIEGCPSPKEQKDGMCSLDTFIRAQSRIVHNTDWEWGCFGNWTVPAGKEWETVTGDYPPKP
ncbi:phosphoglycerate mutase-like protein [Schizopora paradoxa]|uniref:Phosphoglycerate mutase-like protein n=1 Tax=Schizopora paradoxa TaxID=27342 RepID=A0A0H2RL06_9AGAM|nr:phosphoglycerate mutase-like protein [Schizopora paradoxa]